MSEDDDLQEEVKWSREPALRQVDRNAWDGIGERESWPHKPQLHAASSLNVPGGTTIRGRTISAPPDLFWPGPSSAFIRPCQESCPPTGIVPAVAGCSPRGASDAHLHASTNTNACFRDRGALQADRG